VAAVGGIGTGLPTGLAIVDARQSIPVWEGAVEGFGIELLDEEIVPGLQLARAPYQVGEVALAGEIVSAAVGAAEVASAGDSEPEAPWRTHHGEWKESRRVLISIICDTSTYVHCSVGGAQLLTSQASAQCAR
jgi:hypothetical protein